jgi:ADP-ribose pyrophosphatase YjhB (NUDIX family)
VRGYAYYSPKTDAPAGGLCLSAFAILRREGKFLVGKPRPHAKWTEWAPNWDVYDAALAQQQFELWRLPAAYLKEGEGPDDTARRIVLEQVGAQRCFVKQARVLPFHDPSSRFPGEKHWDLCFVYDVDAEPAPSAELPWWRELRWVDAGDLASDDFGSSIGDLVQALGMTA